MADKKNEVEQETAEVEVKPVAPQFMFYYMCPSCSGMAIKTTNKMIGVNVVCESCKKEIRLENEGRYRKL